jgi:hypothetical protein
MMIGLFFLKALRVKQVVLEQPVQLEQLAPRGIQALKATRVIPALKALLALRAVRAPLAHRDHLALKALQVRLAQAVGTLFMTNLLRCRRDLALCLRETG